MRYRVTSPLLLYPGAVVGLTEEQVRRRVGFLEPAAVAGLVRVIKAVGFKAGEEFEYAGELPKTHAAAVLPLVAKPPAVAPASAVAVTDDGVPVGGLFAGAAPVGARRSSRRGA